MKAYKQINFHKENRFFWGYAITLSILSLFIIISPVLAEPGNIDSDDPEVQISVQTEYDKEGHLISADTSRIWCWQGKEFTIDQQDSLFNELKKSMGSVFHRNYISPLGYSGPPSGPFLHRFWVWDESDSSATSFLEGYEYMNSLEQHLKEIQGFTERVRQFQSGRQGLIEKFFEQPWQKDDIDPNVIPNLNTPNKQSDIDENVEKNDYTSMTPMLKK